MGATTVTVRRDRRPAQQLTYATPAEAAEQFDRWVAEAVHFTHYRGDMSYEITLGDRLVQVSGYTSSSSSVADIDGGRHIGFWTNRQVAECHRRRFTR